MPFFTPPPMARAMPRGMPAPFMGRAPSPVAPPPQSPYTAAIGYGGAPIGVGGTPIGGPPAPMPPQPPALRQPMGMSPHVNPNLQQNLGLPIQPMWRGRGAVDTSKYPYGYPVNPNTDWLNDPREKEFDPDTETAYQFRDKLGYKPIKKLWAGGGVNGASGDSGPDLGTGIEPGELDQNPWPEPWQGSYYPPDFMGPTNSPNNPEPPYVGYYGGTDDNPQYSWMPPEYRNYWAHHGGDSGNGGGSWYSRRIPGGLEIGGGDGNPRRGGERRGGGGGGGRENWGNLGNLPRSNLSQRPTGMFGGLPQGWNEMRNPQGAYGAPNFTPPWGSMGAGTWRGDSIFGSRTNLGMALPGSFTNIGGSASRFGGNQPFWSRQQMRVARHMGPFRGNIGGGVGPAFGPNHRIMGTAWKGKGPASMQPTDAAKYISAGMTGTSPKTDTELAAISPNESVFNPKQLSAISIVPNKKHKLLPSQVKAIFAAKKAHA